MAVSPFLQGARRSPWLLVLVGAVVVAVVVGITVVVREATPDSASEAAPAATRPAPSAAPSPAGVLSPTTPVPGLDALGGEEALLNRCLRKEEREDASDARVYNLVTSTKAVAALIYATDWIIGCFIDQPGTDSTEGVSLSTGINSGWMTAPVAIDTRSSGKAADGRPGYDLVGGRLASAVTRVTVELRGKTVDVPVVNHTYLARFERSQNYAESGRENDPRFVVRAFDAAGKEIDSTDGTDTPDCRYDPQGNRLDYWENPPVKPCVTASPWA